jgi:hypothetical protein
MPTLEITTMVGCPLMCTFCPQPQLKGAYEDAVSDKRSKKYLDRSAFEAVLLKVPKHVRIDFSGMAEPWANPECTQMLRHALESGFDVAVYTTLYGMGESDAEAVIDLLAKHRSQVEVVCLHLPDANGNMRGWKPSLEWENVFEKFLELRNSGSISDFRIMTMDGSGQIHPALSRFSIECGEWRGHSRAGSLSQDQIKQKEILLAPPRHSSAVSCTATPFYDHNVLLPNGDVVLCCMDYGLKHIIGNLLENDYYEIFAGSELNKIRTINMKPEYSDCSICKTCDRGIVYEIGADSAWTSSLDTRAVPLSVTPRPWLKPVAELFLTLGRSLHISGASSFGDWLWRK